MKTPTGISLRHDLKPGEIGHIIYLHGSLYAQEYGYDINFESYVAKPLSDFVINIREREKIWLLEQDDELLGSMAIVEHGKSEAQLRWLLLHPDIRGLGLGKELVSDAISFCRSCGYSSIFLWTESILIPAAELYKSKGFVLTEEKTHELWGSILTEQRYELKL